MCPAYVEDSHLPGPTYGALDLTAELLDKLLSWSKDPDVTALSEAVKAKLGITEPLPKPAFATPCPGLRTLPDDLDVTTEGHMPQPLSSPCQNSPHR